MSLFTPIVLNRTRIIKDSEILGLEYIPEQFLHRKELITEIVNIIGPTLIDRPAGNMIIYGASGVGKTASLYYVLRDFDKDCIKLKKDENINLFFITCSRSNTSAAIVRMLCRKLGINCSGQDQATLFSKFLKKIDGEDKYSIIILDEVDKLKTDSDIDWIIRSIVRAKEGSQFTKFNKDSLKEGYIGLICVANDINFIKRLQTGTIESFGNHRTFFPQYTKEQLKDIGKARARKAFRPRTISEEVITKMAEYAEKQGGDARIMIESLYESALIAERNKSKTVELKHFNKAKKRIEDQRIRQRLNNFIKQVQWYYVFTCNTYDLWKNEAKQSDISDCKPDKDYYIVPNANTIHKHYEAGMRYYGRQTPVGNRQSRKYLKLLVSKGLLKEVSELGQTLYAPTLNTSIVKEILMKKLIKTKEEIDKLMPEEVIRRAMMKKSEEINKEIEELRKAEPVK